MKASNGKGFERRYALHLQHLKLNRRPPKTIEAYSRAIRRIGERRPQAEGLARPASGHIRLKTAKSHHG